MKEVKLNTAKKVVSALRNTPNKQWTEDLLKAHIGHLIPHPKVINLVDERSSSLMKDARAHAMRTSLKVLKVKISEDKPAIVLWRIQNKSTPIIVFGYDDKKQEFTILKGVTLKPVTIPYFDFCKEWTVRHDKKYQQEIISW